MGDHLDQLRGGILLIVLTFTGRVGVVAVGGVWGWLASDRDRAKWGTDCCPWCMLLGEDRQETSYSAPVV